MSSMVVMNMARSDVIGAPMWLVVSIACSSMLRRVVSMSSLQMRMGGIGMSR